MDTELTEVRDFLAATPPFDLLTPATLDALPAQLEVRYFRRGSAVLSPGQESDVLYVIRSGAVELVDAAGTLLDRRGVGAGFGMSTLLRGGAFKNYITAIEDTLVLVMPGEVFREVSAQSPEFEAYYVSRVRARIREAAESVRVSDRGSPVLRASARQLVHREPLWTVPSATIRQAAETMRDRSVSSLLVLDGGRLVGIVTDRDLRNRVVAQGRAVDQPVSAIMTSEPVTARADALAFEILLDMVARGIHHVPLLDGDRVVGVVSSTDLIRLQHDNPVYVVGDIKKQLTVDGLAASARRLPQMVAQLVAEDAGAADIARVVTAVRDAVELRLLEMVEEELGAPPVPYAWVVLGSQARTELGLAGDQDNAMVISDDVRPEHAPYFRELARRMVTRLETCGYPLCKGEVMATTDAWRQPLTVWRRTFGTWMDAPRADALVNASIFFDMRPLYGATALVDQLRDEVLRSSPEAARMLAHMTKACAEHQPPLGFFRGFVLEKEGEHADTVDLKRGAIASVVEVARIYALENGIPDLNTTARIEAAAAAGKLSERRASDLAAAFEFVSYIRLRSQAREVREGREPSNHVRPDDLTSAEQRSLKDVFQIVRRAQSTLAARRPLQYIS
jgi:CBS domain-containing protein